MLYLLGGDVFLPGAFCEGFAFGDISGMEVVWAAGAARQRAYADGVGLSAVSVTSTNSDLTA